MISELLDTQLKVYQAFFIVDIKAFSRDTQSWHAFCLLFKCKAKQFGEWLIISNYFTHY